MLKIIPAIKTGTKYSEGRRASALNSLLSLWEQFENDPRTTQERFENKTERLIWWKEHRAFTET